MSGIKKVTVIFLIAVSIVIITLTALKTFSGNSGLKYLPEDTIVMTVEGGDMTWDEYYGWLCYTKAQVEMISGKINNWELPANSQQTYAEYVKDYAVYLISTYKSVEFNSAVLKIMLTDEEKQAIEEGFMKMSDSEKDTVMSIYGSTEFYMYLSELSLLYTKCHDSQYGEKGEKTEDEYVFEYAEQNNFIMFKGMFIDNIDKQTAEEIAAKISESPDKDTEVKKIREKNEITDGYDDGYLFKTGDFNSSVEEKLSQMKVGECSYMVSDNGSWIMLKCEISPDCVIYNSEDTLRMQASWGIFGSVVDGWSENIELKSGSVYDKISLAEVFS